VADPNSFAKLQIESQMLSYPSDEALRAQYFGVLNDISRSQFGSFAAILPEILTPLLFRGATSDVWNMEFVFLKHEYDLPIPAPRRILDVGAYAGYTSVFFANRYPDAEIIAVEPPGANFEILQANTAPYRNIHCVPAAVWHRRAELRLADIPYGDWGTWFKEDVDMAPLASTGPVQAVPAYTIAEILDMHGWDTVDFIKFMGFAGRIYTVMRPRPQWLNQ
jgi:FkbM family methyltransferase